MKKRNNRKNKVLSFFCVCPMLVFTVLFGTVYFGYRTNMEAREAKLEQQREEERIARRKEAQERLKERETETEEPQDETIPEDTTPAVTEPIETDPVETEPEEIGTDPIETEPPAPPTDPVPPPASGSFTTVDASYFDDALFFGNSRIRLLGEYAPLGNAFYYGVDCLTVFGALDDRSTIGGCCGIEEVLATHTFGKVYIGFGINECGYPSDSFIAALCEIIDTVRLYQPDAIIYVEDIMYVTRQKFEDTKMFSTYVLDEKNARIASLANGSDVFYLPLNEIVNDGTGYMSASLSGDGVHLYASVYHIWSDYLLTHAVVK